MVKVQVRIYVVKDLRIFHEIQMRHEGLALENISSMEEWTPGRGH